MWGRGGKLERIFNPQKELSVFGEVNAFDLSLLAKHPEIFMPILIYLFEEIESRLVGAPSIIVINEAWNIVDNSLMAVNFVNFLERMRQKNCVVILSAANFDRILASEVSKNLLGLISTKIFMPNPNSHNVIVTGKQIGRAHV